MQSSDPRAHRRCHMLASLASTQPSCMVLQAVQDRSHAEVLTQLAVGVPLSYMCGAAYYSLFKLGIFSFYHMVPHATDPHSLLMNAGQVSRFAAPLAFNFLHVVRMQEGLRNKEVCAGGTCWSVCLCLSVCVRLCMCTYAICMLMRLPLCQHASQVFKLKPSRPT